MIQSAMEISKNSFFEGNKVGPKIKCNKDNLMKLTSDTIAFASYLILPELCILRKVNTRKIYEAESERASERAKELIKKEHTNGNQINLTNVIVRAMRAKQIPLLFGIHLNV